MSTHNGVIPWVRNHFRRFAAVMSSAVGSPWAFVLACLLVILWVFSKPFFKDFDTWQLVINTATTIITFLTVFLIQNTQNRDGKAIQLKLDELIRAVKGARSRLMDLEDCTDEEIAVLQRQFERLRKLNRNHDRTEEHVDRKTGK